MIRYLLPAAALLLAGSLSAQNADAVSTPRLMGRMSEELERVASLLLEADDKTPQVERRALRTSLQRLRRTAARIPEHGSGEMGFRQLRGDLEALTLETLEWVASDKWDAARQTVSEVRATCVTCHVKYRPAGAKAAPFPAQRNVVSGSIRLRDTSGQDVLDRSQVIVFLERLDAREPWVNHRANPRVYPRGNRFDPPILPVVSGSTVDFPNDDSIFHDIFSLASQATFELGSYGPGELASVPLQDTGVVQVYCKIHPEMQVSLLVLADPYFAVSDAEGRFVLPDVPDGHYRLRAWSTNGVESARPLDIEGGSWVRIKLDLRETRRVIGRTAAG